MLEYTPPPPPAPDRGSVSAAAGVLIFLAALGMMAGLIGTDLKELDSFASAATPAFLGKSLTHFSTVIAAFIGGYMVPNRRAWSAEERETRLNLR